MSQTVTASIRSKAFDPSVLELAPAARAALWKVLVETIEDYLDGLRERPVKRNFDADEVRAHLRGFDFESPCDPVEALRWAVEGLETFHVHNAHPSYLGLFVPAASTMGIAADALAAAYNPNPASWNLSPFAVEAELHLIRLMAGRFGFDTDSVEGIFTSGGSEANHSAVAVALIDRFPEVATEGLWSHRAQPVLYVSTEGHHSILKAARLCGLGSDAVRLVPVDQGLRLDPAALRRQIVRDRAVGKAPFLVVATAGSTSAGVVDPIDELASLAAEESLWLHVDAAWGGAGVLLAELGSLFRGIERADSISFDPHKWLSVPMAAGLFLTRHGGALEATFSIDDPYMPRSRDPVAGVDFYRRSMPWARRFIGLKVFLTLAVAGWRGYETVLRRQIAMGDHLRSGLTEAGFLVVNDTPLPVVCFVDRSLAADQDEKLEALAAKVVASGRAWISTTRIGPERRLVLRAAVTSFHTTEADIDAVVGTLTSYRSKTIRR